MPTRRRPKKGGDANRKTARALLDFKDGFTAGEVKLLLAVATGASLAAIQGRRFREKFPDLAAVFALGPQDRAGTRRNARRPSRVGENAPERRDALRGATGRARGGGKNPCTDGGEGGMILHVPADAANSAEVRDRDTIQDHFAHAFRPSPLAASLTDSRGRFASQR